MPNLLSSLQNILRRHNIINTDDRQRQLSALMRKPANYDHARPLDEFRTDYELALLWAYFKAAYPDPPLLALCRIGTIKLLKKKKRKKKEKNSESEHEQEHEHAYTLAYLTGDGRPWEESASRVGILQCERTVSVSVHSVHDDRDNNSTTAHSTPGLQRSSSNGAGDSDGDDINANELDQVQAQVVIHIHDPDASAALGKDADVVYTHHFDPPSTAPSVSMLIAAAAVLKNDSEDPPNCPQVPLNPNPNLNLNGQCSYWFAALSFRLLVGRPADDLQANPHLKMQMRDQLQTVRVVAPSPSPSPSPSADGPGLKNLKVTVPWCAGGTFNHVFALVTGEEVERCCARLDLIGAFEEKVRDVDAGLARIRERWEREGRMGLELRELRELREQNAAAGTSAGAGGGSSGAAVGG